MVTRYLLGATLIAAASPMLTSCQGVDCGEGTIERDGVCVPADQAVEPGDCGDGTHYDPAEGGSCVPDLPPAQCDPDTTVPIPDPVTGIITCVGTGTTGCGLPCPPPGPGNVSLCGKLYDVEDDSAIEETADGTPCDLENPTLTGPCSLHVAFYPALP